MTSKTANPQHVVVDGSNIATEGRSMPSLAQLNEAVNSYIADHPGVRVTVVVDATFGHRIAPSEVKEFDAAIANTELVAPPAGAVGRGDAFVLSIAKKAKATILSNDSFQEFHGEHEWLFDEGRLVGGKPVPHVGWVWVARSPVRGPISRKAVRASKPPPGRNAAADGGSAKTDQEPTTRRGSGRRVSKEATAPMPVPTTPPPGRATPPRDGRAAPSALSTPPGEVVNELMPFLDFVQHHPVGTSVNATVDSYSSHGAYVKIGDVFGYVPLRLMSDPPPRSAREVMKVGDAVTLVVASFAPARRSIDCAVPNMASVVEPQDGEAVVAEAAGAVAPSAKKAAVRKTTAKKVAAAPVKKAAGSPAKKAAQPRTAKKAAQPSTKKATTASKASAADVLEQPSKEPTAKKAATQSPARKAAPRAANRRTSVPPDEVVSPEARARRRGPRTASGAASGPSPESDTPREAADAAVVAAPAGDTGPPQTSQPRRRSRAAKKVADA